MKEAVKNHSMIGVELHPDVLRALEALPRPKAAAKDCRSYFSSGNSSMRSLVKARSGHWAWLFKRAKVAGAHPHRFRHALASELLARGASFEDIAGILADTPNTVRRHCAKRTECQARQDVVIRLIHGTNLSQTGHEFVTDGNGGANLVKVKGIVWWPGTDLNRRRQPFQGCALPTELPGQ